MASAPTRPALRERFEKRRADVVESAATVFAMKGYDGAAIDDLSDATGLTAGGLYHYIGSKENLLSEIFAQLMDPLLERAIEIADRDEPAEKRLQELIRTWVTHVAAHRDHMLVFSQERHVLERDEKRWREIRSSRRRFEDILSGLIREVATGEHDLEVIHFALLGMVNYTPQWLKPSGRLSPDRIADGYWSMVLAALGQGGGTGR